MLSYVDVSIALLDSRLGCVSLRWNVLLALELLSPHPHSPLTSLSLHALSGLAGLHRAIGIFQA
jgi:hypothetical protein